MYKIICFLCLSLLTGNLFGQTCPNFNSPVPIADSCHISPFFCGSFLDNYCSSNAGMTDDAFGLNSGFLRLNACGSEIAVEISVSNCSGGANGLIFSLYPDSCDASLGLSLDTILNNITDTIIVSNLAPIESYLLSISGLQGSLCEFKIKVVDGIGTAVPGPVECSCTNGGILGPDTICTTGTNSYNLTLPTCFLSFSGPVGGNGEYCPPPDACPGALDSVVLVWHIPPYMHFIGDSTGLSVQVALNDDYMGLDTIAYDTIWVSWMLISSEPVDSLIHCSCAQALCGGVINALPIVIWHEIRTFFCKLSCTQPSCEIDGITYTAPGFYQYSPKNCVDVEVTITEEDPEPVIFGQTICEGSSTTLAVLNIEPNYTYQWSNGNQGPVTVVSPVSTTTYEVTATHVSGNCIYTKPVTVTVIPSFEADLGEVGEITCLEPCFIFQGQSYCAAGNYSIQTGICSTQVFSIGTDPSLFQNNLPPVTICEGECYDFFGQQICSDSTATYIENCTLYVQQVIISPQFSNDLGVVGTVTCSQPCFNFEGTDYCLPGTYSKPDGQCGVKIFSIEFEKVNINQGEVAEITCKEPCVVYNGVEYCQGGTHTITDSCSITSFSIGESLDTAVVSPLIYDCSPTNTHYSVAFTLSGLAPFKVNGDPISGNYFLSDPLLNFNPFAFIIEQDNGCQSLVSGVYDCAQFCTTDAGKLSDELLKGCAGQLAIQIQSVNPPVLAPGDVTDYVLQTADGVTLAHNATGIFNFDPTVMDYNETYYVSLHVGPVNQIGLPDPLSACTDTSENQPIVFYQVPNVAIKGDSSLCEGGEMMLLAVGAETYVWNDGSTEAYLGIDRVDEEYEGLYTVTGTSVYGCAAVDSILVEVNPAQTEGCCQPQLPNAFTPNGDGANDSFIPILPDCNKLEFAEMRVYSRWGELVFKSLNQQDRWDGTAPNGSPASSDTYVFTFRYRLEGDEEKTQKGEVTLLR